MVLVLIFINKKPVETDPIVEVSTSEDALAEKICFVKCGTQNWFAENTGWIDFYLYEFVLD